MNDLTNIVEKFDGFPSLSKVVNRIIELFNKGDVDINILEESLREDPNLTIQVLRIANSPFFGISGEITSIKEACMILGLPNVFNLVTAADVINALGDSHCNAIDISKFWEHSITVGIATTIVAKKVGLQDSSTFICGLLHDIGKLALDAYQPKLYKKILDYQTNNACTNIEAELQVAGFTHAQLGAAIGQYWKLSPAITQPILHHHEKSQIDDNQLIAALHVSNLLVKGIKQDIHEQNLIYEFHSRSLNTLGFKLGDLYKNMIEIDEMSRNNSLMDLVK